ncbi:glutathione S-transferase [Geosmithia morbida]|uniref:Glutathione S-transferase n=1 Tax=Geosmithia morbida TaxID=1094350 RepID=A0A9P5CZ54_9HYPO|nr:glutathione S-transferase [Geosmithia morbida]KAF4120077.1 glutathione S-transferase [Geosmithia morbida]
MPPTCSPSTISFIAPVIQDGDITLAGTGAIVEYVLAKHGNNSLNIPLTAVNHADHLYHWHFINSSLQRTILAAFMTASADGPDASKTAKIIDGRIKGAMRILKKSLGGNYWLFGKDFTTTDIILVFSLTPLKLFLPFYELKNYPAILGYLKRVRAREAYQTAMTKSDGTVPGLEV